MCKLTRQLCAVLSLAALHGLALGGPLLVVVPAGSPIVALTRKDLADIYLDRSETSLHRALMPMDRTEEALRDRYYQSLGISGSSLRLYWARRIFTGRGRPPPSVSASQLGASLSQQKNTVLYVEPNERPPNTRVVATLE
jgi:hypothetical protein